MKCLHWEVGANQRQGKRSEEKKGQSRRAKKKKGIEPQRVIPSTPARATDELRGGKEENGNKERVIQRSYNEGKKEYIIYESLSVGIYIPGSTSYFRPKFKSQ